MNKQAPLPGGAMVPRFMARHASISFIAGSGAALVVCLAVFRVYILQGELAAATWSGAARLLAAGFRQDFIVGVALTGGFALAVTACKGTATGRRLAGLFFALCLILVLWGAANIEMVRMLGGPINMAWLYYSDFLTSNEALSGMLQSLTFKSVALMLIVPAAFFVLSAAATNALQRFHLRPQWPLAAVVLTVVPALPAFVLAGSDGLPSGKLLNPAVAFAQSVVTSGKSDLGLGGAGNGDPLAAAAVSGNGAPKAFAGQIKNVVFYVLESTPAEYVQNFGGVYAVTPNMLKYGAHGMRFTSIYAPAPATNYSLVSQLAASYPEISERGITDKYPSFRMQTIARVLSGLGYRTGYFESSDKEFQNTGEFLASNDFGTIEDYRDRTCDSAAYQPVQADWKFLATSDDACTAKSAAQWIAKESSRPFFAIIKTGMTHYPYFARENQKYAENEDFNRYLNALKTGDEGLGVLMKFLEEKGLADSTLVMVFGDHGEAFGRHGTYSHATGLNEENVHIPLLLINRRLFAGEASGVVGSVIDIAPTALDILGIKPPALWQGASLYAPQRATTAFFFAPWNGFQIGYRQGNRKVIYSANGEVKIYDLGSDPLETRDLAPEDDAARAEAKRVLAGFVKAQAEYASRALEQPVQEAVAPPATLTLYLSGTRFKDAPKSQISVDGVLLGTVAVTSAPSNAEKPAEQSDIDKALRAYVFSLAGKSCPKRIEVKFLNDDWAGENKTGDTNLYIGGADLIQGADYSEEYYKPEDFTVDTPRAGGVSYGYMGLWREGSAHLDLKLTTDCASRELGQ